MPYWNVSCLQKITADQLRMLSCFIFLVCQKIEFPQPYPQKLCGLLVDNNKMIWGKSKRAITTNGSLLPQTSVCTLDPPALVSSKQAILRPTRGHPSY